MTIHRSGRLGKQEKSSGELPGPVTWGTTVSGPG